MFDPGEFDANNDLDGNGIWTEGILNPWYIENNFDIDNQHLKGKFYYDENLVELLFDVYTYDFGDDNVPGDYTFYEDNTVYGFIDGAGNSIFEQSFWEGGNTSIILSIVLTALEVCNVDKTKCPVSAAVSAS